jgi:O-antigen/teichoic acid export membrane protein
LTAARTRDHTLTRSLAWFLGSYGVAIVGYLIVNAVAARFLGSEDFGRFVITYTLSVSLGEAALVGVHRAGVREAARVVDLNDPVIGRLRMDVRTITVLVLPLTGAVSALAGWLLLGSGDGGLATAVAFGCLVVLSGHQKLWAGYLRGFGQVAVAGLLEGRSGGALVSIMQAGFLVAVAVVVPGSGLAGALTALALGYVVPIVLGSFLVRARWRGSRLAPASLLHQLPLIFRRDWRFFVLSTVTNFGQNVELWIGGAILVAQDTSWFSASQRLALLLTFPLMSFQVVFSPAVSRLWQAGEIPTMQRLLRTGASVATLTAAALWVPMVVVPGFVMATAFGNGFRDAGLLLVVLSCGSMCNVLSGLCGTALSMSGHEGTPALLVTVTTVLRVVLGVALALAFGVYGLAASTALLTAAFCALMWWFALRRVGVNTLPSLHPDWRILSRTAG